MMKIVGFPDEKSSLLSGFEGEAFEYILESCHGELPILKFIHGIGGRGRDKW